jgi:hypothetical protein
VAKKFMNCGYGLWHAIRDSEEVIRYYSDGLNIERTEAKCVVDDVSNSVYEIEPINRDTDRQSSQRTIELYCHHTT